VIALWACSETWRKYTGNKRAVTLMLAAFDAPEGMRHARQL
jgi:hypothetical protein